MLSRRVRNSTRSQSRGASDHQLSGNSVSQPTMWSLGAKRSTLPATTAIRISRSQLACRMPPTMTSCALSEQGNHGCSWSRRPVLSAGFLQMRPSRRASSAHGRIRRLPVAPTESCSSNGGNRSADAERFPFRDGPALGVDTRAWREIEQLGCEIAALDRIVGSRIDAKVAIAFDWDSWWSIETGEELCGFAQSLRLTDCSSGTRELYEPGNVAVDYPFAQAAT